MATPGVSQSEERMDLGMTTAPSLVTNQTLSPGTYQSVTGASAKRVFVDADDMNNAIPDKKRGRMELDKGQRDNVLRFVLASHLRIGDLFGMQANGFMNLHVSQQVTSIFCTVHNCLRQDALNTGTLRTAMESRNHAINCAGEKSPELSHKELKSVIKQLAESFELVYSRPEASDNNHWYGTISPILCFINMFKVRIGELRVGHSAMVARKVDGKVHYVSVSQYGFYPPHHINLEGISLPPEKKSGMTQSL